MAMRRKVRHLVCGMCLLATALTVAPAWAEEANKRLAADALFEQAKKLLKDGKTKAACLKFDASQKLDASVGTLLFLGDCYERLGRLSSALASFTQAVKLAEAKKDKRRKVAAVRRVALEPRVSKVRVAVADGNTEKEGFLLRKNGAAFDAASMKDSVMVDAGRYEFEAMATGHTTWSKTIDVEDGGAEVVVRVPLLEPREAQENDAASTGPSASTGARDWGPLAITGAATAGAGVVTMVVGGVFGGLAISANSASLQPDKCRTATLCTPEGLELRDEAKGHATASTIGFVVGGVLAATGTTLFFLDSPLNDDGASAETNVSFAPSALPYGAGIMMRGAW